MSYDTASLPALIGSRICHDLISPIGAISNGLELLTLNGHTGLGPEFELINDSCASANARIRFFRVAFGTAAATQKMGRAEVTRILSDIGQGARVQTTWRPAGDLARTEVQTAFLALLCLETAMPHGGEIVFEFSGGRWTITGNTPRLNMENGLWPLFLRPGDPVEVTPSRVQFALLDTLARSAGRTVQVTQHPEALILTI